MDKIKTSELITKFALASEEACKCEDENFFRVTELDKLHNTITPRPFHVMCKLKKLT